MSKLDSAEAVHPLEMWLESMRSVLVADAALKTDPEMERGTTDTQVATNAVQYVQHGVSLYKAAVAAGTAFTATTHDVAQDKWSSFLLSLDDGTITITKAASDYDTEAEAMAAVPDTPTGEVRLGYLTLKTASGQVWDATTDALAGGSSGNPASVTHYFPDDAPFPPAL